MRAAPIALAARSREEASEAARADARLTHWDRMAGAASAALCAALMALAAAEDPYEATLADVEPHELPVDAVRAAWADDRTGVAALACGPLFGTCWAALAVALCALHLPGYEAGVTWAISLGKDTDTNRCGGGCASWLPKRRHGYSGPLAGGAARTRAGQRGRRLARRRLVASLPRRFAAGNQGTSG